MITFSKDMEKDFQAWHDKKIEIDTNSKRPFFHEKEIWFCSVGINIGFEENGWGTWFLRPVVVLRKFSEKAFWAVPLTKDKGKQNKHDERYYYYFSFVPGVTSIAMLSQVRLVDAKRLYRRSGTIVEEDFVKLKEKLKALLP